MTSRHDRSRTLGAGAAVVGVLAILGGCAGQAPGDGSSSASDSSSSSAAATEVDVDALGGPARYAELLVEATDAARAAQGLDPLASSPCAQEQGALRAAALAESGGELLHAPMGPVSAACAARSTTGENLSRAAVAPQDVVDAWMASPGHRSNILDPQFTEMGIACVVVPAVPLDEALCSQVFLGP